MAIGSTLLPMWIFIGWPVIFASGAEEVLKLLLANFEMNQALILSTFSSEAGKGTSLGQSGVGCLGLTSCSSSSPVSFSSFSVRDEALKEEVGSSLGHTSGSSGLPAIPGW